MDSKEKEKESQNKSGVDYSFPISEYAKQLDFPVRDRYLQKIAAIGIDPVLVEGKDFKPDCLPPVESTDILWYLVLETSFYTQKQFKQGPKLRPAGRQCDWKFTVGDQNFKASRQQATNF